MALITVNTDGLHQRLDSIINETRILRQELADISEKGSSQGKHLDTLKSRISERIGVLEQDLRGLKEDRQRSQSELIKISSQIQTLRQNIETQSSKNDDSFNDLRSRTKSVEEQIKDEYRDLKKDLNKVDNYSQLTRSNLNMRTDTLHQQVTTIEKSSNSLVSAVEGIQHRLRCLEDRQQGLTDAISASNDASARCNHRIDDVQHDVEVLDETIDRRLKRTNHKVDILYKRWCLIQ